MYLTDNANGFGTVPAAGGLCKRAQPKASDLRENEVFCLVLNRQREQLWCCVCGRRFVQTSAARRQATCARTRFFALYLTDNANSFGAVSAEGGLCKRAQPKASDLRENEVFCLVLNRQRERFWCCVCGRVVCANERSRRQATCARTRFSALYLTVNANSFGTFSESTILRNWNIRVIIRVHSNNIGGDHHAST